MAKLVNEFSWSPSRGRLYDDCPRAYYLNYYGSWGGWERDAGPAARLAYRLKQMTNLSMFAGSVVHDVIKGAIARVRDGAPVDRARLFTEAQRALNRAWKESRGEAWRDRSPKYVTTLFEHYYVERLTGRPVPGEAIRATKAKVESCLERYLETDVHAALAAKRGEDVRCYEELTHFQLDGTKVWLAMDLARDTEAGVEIYDWKTGRGRDADAAQLRVYALYAALEWTVPAERIRTHAVYLRNGEIVSEVLDDAALAATRADIGASAERLRALLADPEHNVAREPDFPLTDDLDRCRRCNFQEICHPEGVAGGQTAGYG